MEEKRLQPDVSKKSGSGALALFLLPVVAVGAASVGWLSRPHVTNESAVNGGERLIQSVLHLDTFVLNLADPEERAYLRVGIDLGLGTAAKSKGAEPPVAMVRDTILAVLAVAKPAEVLTPQGKAMLKAALLHALQERAPNLQVQEVFFTEFLIQR
jgi:flagellar basal body-associated protein FliL